MLRVRLEDLDAGDVVTHRRGRQHYRAAIVTLTTVERQPSGEPYRALTLRWLDTGELFDLVYRGTQVMHVVIGGPKLAAANADRTLVTNGKTGVYNWKRGATAPQEAA